MKLIWILTCVGCLSTLNVFAQDTNSIGDLRVSPYIAQDEEDKGQDDPGGPGPFKTSNYGARIGLLIPVSAEVDKLDPFYGPGFFYRWKTDHDSYNEICLDIFFGSGKEELSSGGSTINDSFDDTLYLITYNHGNVQDNDWHTFFGLGLAIERASVEATFGPITIKEDLDAESVTLQGGAGYTTNNVELSGTAIYFLDSENVKWAIILNATLLF